MTMPNEYLVATLAQIAPGCMRRVDAGGERITLYNVDGALFATTDVCPHKGAPLHEGFLDDCVVMCPFHAWEFDVTTGECLSIPDYASLKRFPVRLDGDRVLVLVEAADPSLEPADSDGPASEE